MNRLRHAVIAFGAALVLTGVVLAPTASASFTAGSYPAEIEGNQTQGYWRFQSGQEVGCYGQKITASLSEKPTGVTLPTTVADSESCIAGFKVKMNGCGFTLHIGEPLNEAGTQTDGWIDIANAPGKSCGGIFVTPPGRGSCHNTIAAQNHVPVSLEDISGTHETIHVTLEHEFSLAAGEGPCWATTVWFKGEWLLKGYESGQPHEASHQVNLAAHSELLYGETHFTTSGSFSGGQGYEEGALVYATNTGQKITCGSISLSGSAEYVTPELNVSESNSECISHIGAGLLATEIHMHTCQYHLDAVLLEAGIIRGICGTEGDYIEAVVYQNAEKQAEGKSLCTYHLSPQKSSEETVFYVGSGFTFTMKGIPASRTGSILCGSPATATYSGEMWLNVGVK